VLGAFRLADAIDVVVVSIFVYATITWVRKARSRFVLLGFATLVALYFVARLLDMYLTLFLFQAGVTVALLALVVIFQEEIRRAFERIATSGLLRAGRRRLSGPTELIDPIVDAATTMARQRTGALIVLRGKEPLERHTTGGIELDGRLSVPLLYSIFDPSSAGHDGAVVIEDGLVSKFAVHLPLSTRVKDEVQFGTRHTAAVGLSERSDALIIAISEERGKISIARAGSLREVPSGAELKQILVDFLVEVTPPRQRTSLWQRLFARDLGTKALSFAVALLAWLLVFGQQSETVARTFNIPIVYRDVPDGWLLDDPNPAEARITISGKSRSFELLDPRVLRLSLDGRAIKAGVQTTKLTPSHIELPGGFTVHEIEPESVSFNARQTFPKDVPVQPELVGQLRRGLVLTGAEVEPETLRLMLVQRDRGRVTSLRTEPVDLSAIDGNAVLVRGVVLPRGSRLGRGEPTEVQVRLTVQAITNPH
jgi:uncharacterized protein (TIGR00159 family)